MDLLHFDPRPMDALEPPPDSQPADWVWPGYLARGNITLLTSEWKAGKTTLLAGLLRAMADGGDFLGRPCPPGGAVVVSEESPAHWAARQAAMPVGPRVRLVSRPFVGNPDPRQWDDLVRRVEGLRGSAPLDLVVVDTLATFLPGRSESDAGTLLALLHPLRRLADGGTAVLVLHHPRKRPAAEGSATRGGGALLGFVDVILELHRCGPLTSEANLRRIVGRSRLTDVPPSLVYEWTPGTPHFRLVADPMRERFLANWEPVRAALADRPGDPTAVAVKELLAGWPPTSPRPGERQLYEWLCRAFEEALVWRNGSGTRTDPFRFFLFPADLLAGLSLPDETAAGTVP